MKEVFENDELERRAPTVPDSSGPPSTPALPEHILLKDAEDWESAGSGMGAVMRRALDGDFSLFFFSRERASLSS